ncbi:hypothetical protein AB0K09_00630 [Streptomyces sp. NPDC049577]|uniref:hypothetical protein n=1 Tax=Streptomyces sp. NPDC049577 TaxID=3155153 RepID=UPI00342B447E
MISTGVAKPALINWGAGLVADYVLADPIATARRARTEPTELRRDLVAQPNRRRDRAANLGTRVHHRAAAIVLGTPYPADPEVEPYAQQLAKFFRRWRVDFERDVEAVETTVLNRTHGYAGTGDLWLWLPTGPFGRWQLWLIDYKTSATRPAAQAFPEQAFQLAAYRHAEVALLPDDTEVPAPRPHRTAVLNLRARSHALVELPSGRDVFRAFLGALRTATYLHGAPSEYPLVMPPSLVGPPIRRAA